MGEYSHQVNEYNMSQTIHELPGDHSITADLTDSERHRLLSSKRRRATLDVLAVRADPVELADVARVVAAREDAGEPDEETVDRVATSLHHVHLPTLADVGIVDYDADENRVESSPRRHSS